nr:MAG TPA: hypothetical protein [Caudoviricetes sp.]
MISINYINMFIINSIIILLYIRMCLLGDTLISISPNLLHSIVQAYSYTVYILLYSYWYSFYLITMLVI